LKSKYPSKNPCLTCGATWKVGDEITKIDDKYWCSNPNCSKGGKATNGTTASVVKKQKENHGMFLVPGTETPEIQVDIAAFNQYVQAVRMTCYKLALDLNPDGDEFSLRVGTAGLIHDAVNHQAQSRNTRALLEQTVVLSDIHNTLQEIKSILSKKK